MTRFLRLIDRPGRLVFGSLIFTGLMISGCAKSDLAANVTQDEWNHDTIWEIVERQGVEVDALQDYAALNASSEDPDTLAYLGLIKSYVGEPIYDAQSGYDYLNRACDAGHARACRSMARPILKHIPSAADWPRAIELLEDSCSRGVGLACQDLAVHYAGNIDAPIDPQKALRFTEASCETPKEDHCAYSAFAYRYVDVDAARVMLRQLCDKKLLEGCHLYASAISMPGFDTGNTQIAMDLFDQNCQHAHPGSCIGLFYLLNTHEEMDVQYPDSEVTTQAFCEAGKIGACRNLTHYYSSPKTQDLETALRMNRFACDLGDTNFCYWLGNRYEQGIGTEPSIAKAKMVFNRLCAVNYQDSCYREVALGNTFDSMNKTNVDGAVCQQGDPEYCRTMAWNHATGEGVAASPEKAIKLFEQSCSDGLAISCADLGSLYDFAMYGVEQDKSKAKTYYRQGCDLGEHAACLQLEG